MKTMNTLNNSGQSIIQNERNLWLNIIEILIILIGLGALIYVYGINSNNILKIIISLFIVAVVVGTIVRKKGVSTNEIQADVAESTIKKVVLLDEENERLKEWYIKGETSLIIGKNSTYLEVDIDLTETEYEALISYQHAILNYYSGKWYIEDLDSVTGTGIKKGNKFKKIKLEDGRRSIVDSGDIIYIANTRILVK